MEGISRSCGWDKVMWMGQEGHVDGIRRSCTWEREISQCFCIIEQLVLSYIKVGEKNMIKCSQ